MDGRGWCSWGDERLLRDMAGGPPAGWCLGGRIYKDAGLWWAGQALEAEVCGDRSSARDCAAGDR